jgi:hypothetical protein
MRITYIGFRSLWAEKDFWHTHLRAFQRYKLPLLGHEIIHTIPQLIERGQCSDADYAKVSRHARKKGFAYFVVPYKSRELIVVFNKRYKRITTLLQPKEFNGMYNEFEKVLENQIHSDLAFKISKIFNQLTIELYHEPSKEQIRKVSGIPLKILSNFSSFFN